MNKKTSLAIKTSLIIITAVASQMSIGFSSWYATNTNSITVDDIGVEVAVTSELDKAIIYKASSSFRMSHYFFEIDDNNDEPISSSFGHLLFDFEIKASEIKSLFGYSSETTYNFTLLGSLAIANKSNFAAITSENEIFASADAGYLTNTSWTPAYSEGISNMTYGGYKVDFTIKTTISASASSNVSATLDFTFDHKLVYNKKALFKNNCFLLTIKKGAKI